MSTATQGITILDDEKALDLNPFDIFSLEPKEVHMKSGKQLQLTHQFLLLMQVELEY